MYDPLTGQKRQTIGAESEEKKTKPGAGYIDLTQSCPFLAFSPDAKLIAVAGAQGAVRICSAETGQELAVLRAAKQSAIESLAFSSDGKTLACAYATSALIWDVSKIQASGGK